MTTPGVYQQDSARRLAASALRGIVAVQLSHHRSAASALCGRCGSRISSDGRPDAGTTVAAAVTSTAAAMTDTRLRTLDRRDMVPPLIRDAPVASLGATFAGTRRSPVAPGLRRAGAAAIPTARALVRAALTVQRKCNMLGRTCCGRRERASRSRFLDRCGRSTVTVRATSAVRGSGGSWLLWCSPTERRSPSTASSRPSSATAPRPGRTTRCAAM